MLQTDGTTEFSSEYHCPTCGNDLRHTVHDGTSLARCAQSAQRIMVVPLVANHLKIRVHCPRCNREIEESLTSLGWVTERIFAPSRSPIQRKSTSLPASDRANE